MHTYPSRPMKLPQPIRIVFFIISVILTSFVDVIYRILLVADLEIEPFAISGQIEYVFVLLLVFFVRMEPDTRRVTPIRIMADVVIIFISYQV